MKVNKTFLPLKSNLAKAHAEAQIQWHGDGRGQQGPANGSQRIGLANRRAQRPAHEVRPGLYLHRNGMTSAGHDFDKGIGQGNSARQTQLCRRLLLNACNPLINSAHEIASTTTASAVAPA